MPTSHASSGALPHESRNSRVMTIDFNMAAVHEAIGAAIADHPCLVWGERSWTWAEMTDRSRRVANYLLSRSSAVPTGREFLDGHESGQAHLGIYLYNGNEYLETMLGAYKARVAPFNVNYRYVADELAYLLRDANCEILVYSESFSPTLAEVLPGLPGLAVLICVADGSGHGLLPHAVWYEDIVASSSGARPDIQAMGGDWSPDDLYILYTGGTTGMPKGVLWRQADIFVSAMGGSDQVNRTEWDSLDAIVENAVANAGQLVALTAPPLMHGAAQWITASTWHRGGTVVLQSNTRALDPVDLLSTCERHKVTFLQIVGDAFGRPIIDEVEQPTRPEGPYDLSKLTIILSGGAPMSAGLKNRFLAALPNVMLIDGIGSSEAGGQMSQIAVGAQAGAATTGTFLASPGNHVLHENLTEELAPGHEGLGWLARSGRLPLGYFGDAAKTARTFPVVQGRRYAVPGDRARLLAAPADGSSSGLPVVELHGRDSVTINSGGEKIFAEEVEAALLSHPAVYDVVVAGRPSERWGQEVVAVIQLSNSSSAPTDDELLEHAGHHIARYKLPKAIIRRTEIVRSPSGKADYRWAKAVAGGEV